MLGIGLKLFCVLVFGCNDFLKLLFFVMINELLVVCKVYYTTRIRFFSSLLYWINRFDQSRTTNLRYISISRIDLAVFICCITKVNFSRCVSFSSRFDRVRLKLLVRGVASFTSVSFWHYLFIVVRWKLIFCQNCTAVSWFRIGGIAVIFGREICNFTQISGAGCGSYI